MIRRIFSVSGVSVVLAILVCWHSPACGVTVWGQITYPDGEPVVGAQVKFIDETEVWYVFDHTNEEGVYEVIILETEVDEQSKQRVVPKNFELLESYPNPFSASAATNASRSLPGTRIVYWW